MTGLILAYMRKKQDDPSSLPDREDIFYMFVKLDGCAQMSAAGLLLINILQVYNWFTQKHICTMLALYFLAQFLGYMTPIKLLHFLFDAAKPRMYYIGGAAFAFLGFLDIWVFYFNPLQVNIYLD